MRDRQPTRPGRVKITPESGEAYFAVIEMADEPTEVGTPPTKANLLKDTTAELLGGDSSMVPDEALVALKNLIDGLTPEKIGAGQVQVFSYAGTGKYGSANPTSVTFGFAPKYVRLVMQTKNGNFKYMDVVLGESAYGGTIEVVTDLLTTNFVANCGLGLGGYNYTFYGKKSADGKTISWYQDTSAATQFNESGFTYYGIAIG